MRQGRQQTGINASAEQDHHPRRFQLTCRSTLTRLCAPPPTRLPGFAVQLPGFAVQLRMCVRTHAHTDTPVFASSSWLRSSARAHMRAHPNTRAGDRSQARQRGRDGTGRDCVGRPQGPRSFRISSIFEAIASVALYGPGANQLSRDGAQTVRAVTVRSYAELIGTVFRRFQGAAPRKEDPTGEGGPVPNSCTLTKFREMRLVCSRENLPSVKNSRESGGEANLGQGGGGQGSQCRRIVPSRLLRGAPKPAGTPTPLFARKLRHQV